MTTERNSPLADVDPANSRRNHRLEASAWGLFLVILGTLWLLPETEGLKGVWLIAAGLIMLGLNAARYVSGLSTSGFTVILGMLALTAGLSGHFGWNLPLFAICFLVAGTVLFLKALFAVPARGTPRSEGCCSGCAPRC
jgi:hypothetical protein